jgi:hypothetical protein
LITPYEKYNMKYASSNFKKSALGWTTGALLALGLAACGGGGGGSPDVPVTPPPPVPPVVEPALALNTLQGRWASANGDLAMRWVPPAVGQTTATLWGLSSDGTYLMHLSTSVNGPTGVTAKGKRYSLSLSAGQVAEPVALDWTGAANVKVAPKTLTFAGGPALSLQDPLKDGALQLNAVGRWQSNLGLTSLDFDVDALGVITGKSQTGCLYVGVLNARTDVTVYELKLSEACAGGLIQQFTGIAVLSSSANANINQLTLAMVNADSTLGKALYFQRQ